MRNRISGYVREWPIHAGVLEPKEPTEEQVKDAWQDILSFQDTVESLEGFYDAVLILSSDKNPKKEVRDGFREYQLPTKQIFRLVQQCKDVLKIATNYTSIAEVAPNDQMIADSLRVFTAFPSIVEAFDSFYDAIQILRRSRLDGEASSTIHAYNLCASPLWIKVHAMSERMQEAIASS